jgi:hypothetical protein
VYSMLVVIRFEYTGLQPTVDAFMLAYANIQPDGKVALNRKDGEVVLLPEDTFLTSCTQVTSAMQNRAMFRTVIQRDSELLKAHVDLVRFATPTHIHLCLSLLIHPSFTCTVCG